MKIRRFYGKDMREALKQVKDELGGDAVIMSNKKHADGIEIVAAYDKEPDAQLLSGKIETKVQAIASKKTPTLSEIIGDTGPDSLKALLEKQSQSASPTQIRDSNQVPETQPPVYSSRPVNAQPTSQQNDNQQNALKEMRQELSSLRAFC